MNLINVFRHTAHRARFVVICEIFILLGAKCEILPAAGKVTLKFTYSAKEYDFSVKQTTQKHSSTSWSTSRHPPVCICRLSLSSWLMCLCVWGPGGTHCTDYFAGILLSGNYSGPHYLGKVSLGDFIASAKCNWDTISTQFARSLFAESCCF